MTLVNYVRRLHSPLSDVHSEDSVRLAQLAMNTYRLNKKTPAGHLTSAELLCGEASPTSRFAFQRVLTPVKFFYDVDEYRPDVVPQADLTELQQRYTDQIVGMISKLEGAENVNAADVKCATRHGILFDMARVNPVRFKISFRFFVQGLQTTIPVIKHTLLHAGFSRIFDMSIYSSTRKMCMIFGIKTKTDTRCLLPVEDIDAPDFRPEAYLIQHVEESWPVIQSRDEVVLRRPHRPTKTLSRLSSTSTSMILPVDQTVPADPRIKKGGSQSIDEEDLQQRGSQAEEEEEEEEGTEQNSEERLLELLAHFGFKDVKFVGQAATTGEGITCHNFDADNRVDCPLCKKAHDSNMWFLKVQRKRSISISSHSPTCESVDVMRNPPWHKFTKLLFKGDRHADYAQTYMEEIGPDLEYSLADGEWMSYVGDRWMAVDPIVLQLKVSVALELIILAEQNKAKLLQRIAIDHNLPAASNMLKETQKTLKNAYNNVGCNGFMESMLKNMRTLCVTTEIYNTKPHLFHFTDGVYDLDLDLFRATLPTDRNSFTAGYDFYPVGRDLESDLKDVELFYTQLMPLPLERACLQKYFGITLSGRTDVKYFGNLTDIRSGNNGKSTVVTFLKDTLGAGLCGYAAVTKKDMLYTSNGSNTEGASPYLLSLKGKRLASFEEMDASKKFSTDNIKEWTGGVPWDVAARTLYSKTIITFAFTAKILLCFNENRSPRYDVSDSAFIARMLVFPFR
jgi:hypothetical protein